VIGSRERRDKAASDKTGTTGDENAH